MGKIWWPSVVASLALAVPAAASSATCDRACLLGLLDQTLASMAKHDPSSLPLAHRYRLTVDNIPSGVVMATPWRTITGYRKPGPGQYAVDTTQQEVAFLVLVQEGRMPATLAGRLKVDDGKVSELELFLGRSKSDSGMQFAPQDLLKLPRAWTVPVPAGTRRATRAELTQFGMGDNSSLKGAAEECAMMENGHVVSDYVSVEAWLHMAPPDVAAESVEEMRRKNEAAHGGPIQFGCTPDSAVHADKQRRVVVDEEQGVVATFALVNGMVVPNFLPPPGPNPEYPTAFVPYFAKDDLAWRIETAKNPPADASAFAEPMPAVLQVMLLVRIYDGKLQGLNRYMQAQPVGGGSPWYAQ